MRWILPLLGFLCLGLAERPATVTRTELHVARSLDPDKTELRTVRTRTGETATLVVKRRDGKGIPQPTPPHQRPVESSSHQASVNGENKDGEKEKNRTAKSEEGRVPYPVVIRSGTVLVKGERNDFKRARNVMEVDGDGIPVVTGVRMPDTEEDKRQVWRNARVINGVLVPYEKSQDKSDSLITPPPNFKSPENIEWLKMEPITRPVSVNPWRTEGEQRPSSPTTHPQWLPTVNRQDQVIAYPLPSVSDNNRFMTDKILEYIKSVNKEEILNRQRLNLSKGRGSRGMKESLKMEARVLHTPGATVYPTSLLYSPTNSQNGRVRVEEGVRTPILQYAHPELGVQAALVSPPDEEVDVGDYGRDKALAYFAHDIHSDRSPFAFEPGLEDEARVEDYAGNDKRSNNGYSHRPKKTLSYFYNDQSLPYSGKHYGKHGYKDSYNHKYNEYIDRRPFWEKLGDTIKEHVEYGVGRVQDITRPVMEPLVEATHKISENLGFNTGTRDLNSFKEKLGVAGSSSMILPALGLVAGGAALGLGAVAVGRFLNVDMLKRSANGVNQLDGMPLEHKRALVGIEQARARYRRSTHLGEEALQRVEGGVTGVNSGESWIPESAWGSTPCAKRVFCLALLSKTQDDVELMEKKMATYLRMFGGGFKDEVGPHLDEVMSAIRRRDCSVFQCPVNPFPR